MKTFKELVLEEIEDGKYLHPELAMYYEDIERAAIRYANQQVADLQARILSYRHHYVTSFNLGVYDQHFEISNDRVGCGDPKG